MSLPPRQLQVLQMLADGDTVDSMAKKLGVSTSSVRVYKIRLFDTLGVNNSPGAVSVGYRRGHLAVDPDTAEDIALVQTARDMGLQIALIRPQKGAA